MPGRRGRSCAPARRSSRVGRFVLAIVASTWLFGATATRARAASALPARAASVLIVRPANTPPVMVETLVRLRGELISAGFETEIVDAGAAAAGAAGESR